MTKRDLKKIIFCSLIVFVLISNTFVRANEDQLSISTSV